MTVWFVLLWIVFALVIWLVVGAAIAIAALHFGCIEYHWPELARVLNVIIDFPPVFISLMITFVFALLPWMPILNLVDWWIKRKETRQLCTA